MTELRGIAVVGGSRVGRALLFDEVPDVTPTAAVPPSDVEAEVERLHRAAELAQQDLESLQESVSGKQEGVSQIFRAHAEMLEDFIPKVMVAIREGATAEHAVATVFHSFASVLAQKADPVFAQRAQDIIDLQKRMLRALSGLQPASPDPGAEDGAVVVVATDLTPSETAALQGRNIAAIALEYGGATSHTALIAKSLGIPCVVGVPELSRRVQPGDTIWVDGSSGTVVIEPDAATVERAVGLGERYERLEARLIRESDLPAETLDGHRALLLANVEFPLDVEAGMARGAQGVGLFRTEFLRGASGEIPSEAEQIDAYRQTLTLIEGRPITIRTFDFGMDKVVPGIGASHEPNPALGERSLRWCFANPEAFHTQLRALLRVAAEGDVRIMLPMVGSLEEVRAARAALRRAADELAAEDIPHRADPPLGVMIEIPAAATTADLLAREVDFFSIGTNDLIQYDLAVDRLNSRVAQLFRPSHPSVLRLVQTTIQVAADADIPVTMCGEMGGHSIYTVLLLGMGLRAFSLTPGYIPRARRLIRSLTLRDARAIAAQALRMETAEDVEALLLARVEPVGAG